MCDKRLVGAAFWSSHKPKIEVPLMRPIPMKEIELVDRVEEIHLL